MRLFPARPLTSGLLAFAITLALSATGNAAAATEEWVFVGTHGPAPAAPTGEAPNPIDKATQGIYLTRLDLKTGALAAPIVAYELHHATFLIRHPTLPIIYAVAEDAGSQEDTDLFSFKVDKVNERLVLLNKVDSGGHGAAALALDESTGTLLAAHYVSGSVSALSLKEDGSLGAVISSQAETGSGPSPRQKSAHAHDVVIAPDHRFALVSDLGADRIFIYRINPTTRALSPAKIPSETLPAGSGPRHLAFHPNGKYVLVDSELTAELRSYKWLARTGRLAPVQVVQAYPAGQAGDKSAAELALSKDGRFAYVSLRGDQNSLVVYSVDANRGTLMEIQRIAAGGKTPWSFGIDPTGHYLLVANEGSNSVAVLSVDADSGRLSTTGQSVTVPRPVSVVFSGQ